MVGLFDALNVSAPVILKTLTEETTPRLEDERWYLVPGGSSPPTIYCYKAADTRAESLPGIIAHPAGGVFEIIGGANAIAGIEALKLLVESPHTGTSYTLALTDAFLGVTMANSSPNIVTIPPTGSVAFPLGSQVIVHQIGAGKTTIAGDSGVSLNGAVGGSVAIAARWGAVTLWKRDANTWSAIGGIE